MLNNSWFKKEKPFVGFGGFGGGVAGLQFFSGVAQSDTITGSGGVVTAGVQPGDGYTYHTFLENGTFTWTGGSDNSYCEFLIVAGGGGGANARVGGGGGAGQVLQSVQYAVPDSNGSSGISVTVGDGGPKVSGPDAAPGYGGNTIISSPVGIITALGGGWGGYTEGGNNGGNARGSGGGGRANETTTQYFPNPTFGWPFGYSNPYPTVGVGSDLARGANYSIPTIIGTYGGGGGGGAWIAGGIGGFNNGGEAATYPTWIESTAAPYSTPGKGWANPTQTQTTARGGCGGDGLRLHTYRASQYLPSPNPYYPFLNAMNGYYGGGGGGGHVSPYPNYSNDLAPGGLGGGGCGTNEGNSSTVPGMNGTGGGGGGGGNSTGGSDGGDGICVIRYKADVTTVTGGTKTDHGGSTFHVFTEPGVFEVPATSPRVGQTMKIMAVAGGGGGGAYNGGGGGAGLYYVNSSVTVTAGRMAVVIGQGGRGANCFWAGNQGGTTSPKDGNTERGPYAGNGHPTFTIGAPNVGVPAEISLLGGGAGGSNSYDNDGQGFSSVPNGGCGGGGSDNGNPGAAGPSPYSYAGGNATNNSSGAGGGGATAAGGNPPGGSTGGAGGAGVGTPWIPSSLPALYGEGSGPIMYHAGGGGGGGRPGGSNSNGGLGGAGNGAAHHPGMATYSYMRAIYATGSGGGGGAGGPNAYVGPFSNMYSTTSYGRGGEGAPGTMIIQYTSV